MLYEDGVIEIVSPIIRLILGLGQTQFAQLPSPQLAQFAQSVSTWLSCSWMGASEVPSLSLGSSFAVSFFSSSIEESASA